PEGQTPQSFLRHLTYEGARERWRSMTERIRRQLEHELAVIAKLDLAGYFLIVWDIVRFCRERGILCQGRGSAANSAVCNALGFGLDQVDRLAKLLRQHGWHDQHDELAAQLRNGGVDPDAPRIGLLVDLVRRIQGLPRHLGQHTGGMVIAAGRLDDVVP